MSANADLECWIRLGTKETPRSYDGYPAGDSHRLALRQGGLLVAYGLGDTIDRATTDALRKVGFLPEARPRPGPVVLPAISKGA